MLYFTFFLGSSVRNLDFLRCIPIYALSSPMGTPLHRNRSERDFAKMKPCLGCTSWNGLLLRNWPKIKPKMAQVKQRRILRCVWPLHTEIQIFSNASLSPRVEASGRHKGSGLAKMHHTGLPPLDTPFQKKRKISPKVW